MWDVQQRWAIQDADNLRCDSRSGCGDQADMLTNEGVTDQVGSEKATIEYGLKSLLFFGQCYDVSNNTPPTGLQLTLNRERSSEIHSESEAEIQPDGSQSMSNQGQLFGSNESTDTVVMKTVGYWQLSANPGVWDLRIASKSRGAEIYDMVEGIITGKGRVQLVNNSTPTNSKILAMKDFTNQASFLLVKRKKGLEEASLFSEKVDLDANQGNETVHVFSLATGHAYERLLKIMMLSVTKRTSSPVKFWLFENVSNTLYDVHPIRLLVTPSHLPLSVDSCSFSHLRSRHLPVSWQSALDATWNLSHTSGPSGFEVRAKSKELFGDTKSSSLMFSFLLM